jgi:hypothetical protein
VLYLVFDWIAEAVVRLLGRFGYRREQLVWLVGETHLHREDASKNGERGEEKAREQPVAASAR